MRFTKTKTTSYKKIILQREFGRWQDVENYCKSVNRKRLNIYPRRFVPFLEAKGDKNSSPSIVTIK